MSRWLKSGMYKSFAAWSAKASQRKCRKDILRKTVSPFPLRVWISQVMAAFYFNVPHSVPHCPARTSSAHSGHPTRGFIPRVSPSPLSSGFATNKKYASRDVQVVRRMACQGCSAQVPQGYPPQDGLTKIQNGSTLSFPNL